MYKVARNKDAPAQAKFRLLRRAREYVEEYGGRIYKQYGIKGREDMPLEWILVHNTRTGR